MSPCTRESRNLCPATYLATLFTGQEAVWLALAAPFLRYNCRFLRARTRARAQSGRSFFANLLCPVVRNSRDCIATTSADPNPGPNVRSQRRPFLPALYHTALLFCACFPLLRDRVPAFTVVRPSIRVSIFMRSFPRNCDRRKCKRSSIFNRSLLLLLPSRSFPFRVAERR